MPPSPRKTSTDDSSQKRASCCTCHPERACSRHVSHPTAEHRDRIPSRAARTVEHPSTISRIERIAAFVVLVGPGSRRGEGGRTRHGGRHDANSRPGAAAAPPPRGKRPIDDSVLAVFATRRQRANAGAPPVEPPSPLRARPRSRRELTGRTPRGSSASPSPTWPRPRGPPPSRTVA